MRMIILSMVAVMACSSVQAMEDGDPQGGGSTSGSGRTSPSHSVPVPPPAHQDDLGGDVPPPPVQTTTQPEGATRQALCQCGNPNCLMNRPGARVAILQAVLEQVRSPIDRMASDLARVGGRYGFERVEIARTPEGVVQATFMPRSSTQEVHTNMADLEGLFAQLGEQQPGGTQNSGNPASGAGGNPNDQSCAQQ